MNIDCDKWTDCGVEGGGCCSEGRYGGKPSFGTCVYICKKIPMTDKNVFPPLSVQAENFTKAVFRMTTAMLTNDQVLATDEQFDFRFEICQKCEYMIGGRCSRCGCVLKLKLNLTTERCPAGKW